MVTGLSMGEAKLEIFDLAGILLFNQDMENQPREKLKEFKEAIRAADALLIVTLEYNYSIPGVLKNALDCASRPYGDNAPDGKPVGIMGASFGMLGTARAQYHLRQSCVFLNMYPLNSPEIMVPFAHEKIDDKGRLTDPKTREKVEELITALIMRIMCNGFAQPSLDLTKGINLRRMQHFKQGPKHDHSN